MIALLMRATGVNKLAAWGMTVASAGLLLWGASALFNHWLNGVKREAMAAQKAVDQLAFVNAQIAAERKQSAIITAAVERGIQIGAKHADDYASKGAATDGVAAALVGLWGAQAQAGAGGARQRAAVAIPGSATGNDPAAFCAAQGWVSLPLAVRIAAGADREAARGDALSGFISDTAAGWPK